MGESTSLAGGRGTAFGGFICLLASPLHCRKSGLEDLRTGVPTSTLTNTDDSAGRFDSRAFLPDTERVKGAEFIRRVRKLGRRRDVFVKWIPERGKGSHGTLYYGARFTIVQNLNTELKKATLHAMLDQLGLTLMELLRGEE